MLYVEIGLPHTEFIPRKKLVDPPRLLPDYSKMSARYSGLEEMPQFEINALCERLSKPKRHVTEEGHGSRVHCAHNSSRQSNASSSSSSRFIGKKKMTSKDIKSLVDRLSASKSSRAPDSQRIQEEKSDRGVLASHAWNGHVQHFPKYSREHLEKHVIQLRSNF